MIINFVLLPPVAFNLLLDDLPEDAYTRNKELSQFEHFKIGDIYYINSFYYERKQIKRFEEKGFEFNPMMISDIIKRGEQMNVVDLVRKVKYKRNVDDAEKLLEKYIAVDEKGEVKELNAQEGDSAEM